MNNVLMLFIDGLGKPEEIDNHLYSYKAISEILKKGYSLDAVMGVKGLPQSGTGQTSLFCGVNAQYKVGSHRYAFPGKELKEIIKEENLFRQLMKKDIEPIFANAYTRDYFRHTRARRSVTTWQVIYSTENFLFQEELSSGKAVYHDITNAGYPVRLPPVTPEQAAHNLLQISSEYRFTLFEYFLTDRIGHGRIKDLTHLKVLDRFLYNIINNDRGISILITSDHGNVEDISSRTHTFNPVPLYLSEDMCRSDIPKDLSEVRRFILDLFD